MNRDEQLTAWVSEQVPNWAGQMEPASADASFRRYFRIRREQRTWIVMDAPPPQEDCRPFAQVASLMREAGLHVPDIHAQDFQRGFLLLSDLGSTTYLDVINQANAGELFDAASDALIRWQLASREQVLPPYDEALLRRELDLFPDWYIHRHLQRPLDAAQRSVLDSSFDKIIRCNVSQPCVFVHRDYMPRNLMLSDPNPGVLDFQDAVYGPITYDVASLFKDAFISWPEPAILDWTIRYWEKAKRAQLPVDADFGVFYRDLEWMGLQRHLKVLGIFARIHYRDAKPRYLTDAARFVGYVRAVCRRYSDLFPLLRLLDQLAIVDAEPSRA